MQSPSTIAGMVAAAFTGAMLATALSSGGAAQTTSEVVTATQVNLLDGRGQLRGILSGEDERGMASLAFLDPTGATRALLGVGEDGTPRLELYDGQSVVRAVVTVEGDIPAVVVSEREQRAVLSTLNGSPRLTFQNGPRVSADLGLDPGGEPRLGLFGPTGQAQVALNIDGNGAPLLALRDQEGRSRASLAFVQEATVLNLSDGSAARVVVGVAGDGNATVSVLDADGNLTARLP